MTFCAMPGQRARMEADVRLIAAAPELYDVALAILEWAAAPGEHGGNPYTKQVVKMAERVVAAVEDRPAEDWSGGDK